MPPRTIPSAEARSKTTYWRLRASEAVNIGTRDTYGDYIGFIIGRDPLPQSPLS